MTILLRIITEAVIAVKNFLMAALLIILAAPAEAKLVTDKLPLLTYAEAPVALYEKPESKSRGTIPIETSLVQVKEIRADGWAYGSYKPMTESSRVYRWFKFAELQGYENFENYSDRAKFDASVYRTRTSLQLAGKIARGDELIVVAERGSRVKIIFLSDGNFYRMGWLDKSALEKNSTSTGSDNSSSDTGDTTSTGDTADLIYDDDK